MAKKRRKYLTNNALNTEYAAGMRVWIDSILNKDSNTLIDQTGNYQSTTLDGSLSVSNNYIYLSNCRFSLPCGADLQGDFTISVTYRRFFTGTGMIYSFADPTQYLTGRMYAGHNPNNSNNWKISSFSSWQFLYNDLAPHTIDVVVDRNNKMVYVYDNGNVVNTYHSLDTFETMDSNLKLIIGGYMNSDKKMEFGGLYSLKLYNHALSAAEVKQNYNIDKARFGL